MLHTPPEPSTSLLVLSALLRSLEENHRYSHLQGAGGTQVGLEDILETLSSGDVHLQGLSSPLDEMLVRATEGSSLGV